MAEDCTIDNKVPRVHEPKQAEGRHLSQLSCSGECKICRGSSMGALLLKQNRQQPLGPRRSGEEGIGMKHTLHAPQGTEDERICLTPFEIVVQNQAQALKAQALRFEAPSVTIC